MRDSIFYDSWVLFRRNLVPLNEIYLSSLIISESNRLLYLPLLFNHCKAMALSVQVILTSYKGTSVSGRQPMLRNQGFLVRVRSLAISAVSSLL